VLLRQVADVHHRLETVWADGGYTGSLVEHCLAAFALVLAIAKRSDEYEASWCCPSGGSSRRKNDGSVMKTAHRIAAGGWEVDLPLWADAAGCGPCHPGNDSH
jgi:hypothetical protein